ncbi:hypothetical protein ABIA20_000508 [Sinorhizobium fredii]
MLISDSLRSHSSGFYYSRLRTALSALASDGISYIEIAGPSGGTGHEEESEAETAVSLGELMDRHIAAQLATADAVRAWDERRAAGEVTDVAYANRLLGVARDEEAGRLAIVNYRPRGDRESRLKLTYMAAYLIATRGTLNANEMNSVLEAPRDRPSASVS